MHVQHMCSQTNTGCWQVLSPTREETSYCFCQNGVNLLRRLVLQKKKKLTACVSMLKSSAYVTCSRACFLPGRAKDLSPRYTWCIFHSSRDTSWRKQQFFVMLRSFGLQNIHDLHNECAKIWITSPVAVQICVCVSNVARARYLRPGLQYEARWFVKDKMLNHWNL